MGLISIVKGMETQCSDWLLAGPSVNQNSTAGKGELIFILKSGPYPHCRPTSLLSASHRLHKPNANISCFQKRSFIAGITLFNILTISVTKLKNDKAKFISAFRIYLNTHSSYSVDEFFVYKDDFYNTVLQNVSNILHSKCLVYLLYFSLVSHPIVFVAHSRIYIQLMYICKHTDGCFPKDFQGPGHSPTSSA